MNWAERSYSAEMETKYKLVYNKYYTQQGGNTDCFLCDGRTQQGRAAKTKWRRNFLSKDESARRAVQTKDPDSKQVFGTVYPSEKSGCLASFCRQGQRGEEKAVKGCISRRGWNLWESPGAPLYFELRAGFPIEVPRNGRNVSYWEFCTGGSTCFGFIVLVCPILLLLTLWAHGSSPFFPHHF